MSIDERFKKAPLSVKLKVLRALNGMTAQEAADKCGVAYKTYVTAENETTEPQPLTKKAICATFGISEKELFGEN